VRPRLLLAVALVAAATGAGAVRAAPAIASLAPVAPAFGDGVPVTTLSSYGARGMHVVGYEHDVTTPLILTLHNDGPLPMTVTSLELAGGVAPLLSLGGVEGLPLALTPGERAEVTATATLDNCRYTHERQVENHDGVRVGVRVLGTSAVWDVPFDRPLLVHSPMIVGCPDRKLNRQADNRKDLLQAG
jgi:hypothetical protein